MYATIASLAATAVLARRTANIMPTEFQDYLHFTFKNLLNKFSTQLTMVISEFDESHENELYNAAQHYLAARRRISAETHRLKVTKNPNDKDINFAMEINQDFTDVYSGVEFKWTLISTKSTRGQFDIRALELTFHHTHKDLAVNEYIPFILNDATMRKTVKLFTVDSKITAWTSVNLHHPATFATMAMDGDVKEMVMKDLDRFVARKEHYWKVGKAWKRGYLLYGPPGTGKSSLIAAMANYLKFDIYELELTDIKSNSELRRLLVATANRSIVVVEDIDCSVELHDREAKPSGRKNHQNDRRVTMSGFLNIMDGLWSSCGDERIIIFTTNRKEKLDPALLRPGRMDVHIHMSYCTPCGFRLLASNYLGISQHKLFEEIEDLVCKVDVTPSEVAEQLLKDDDPDIALSGLIEVCEMKREKKMKKAEAKVRKEELATKGKEKVEDVEGTCSDIN